MGAILKADSFARADCGGGADQLFHRLKPPKDRARWRPHLPPSGCSRAKLRVEPVPAWPAPLLWRVQTPLSRSAAAPAVRGKARTPIHWSAAVVAAESPRADDRPRRPRVRSQSECSDLEANDVALHVRRSTSRRSASSLRSHGHGPANFEHHEHAHDGVVHKEILL